MLRDPPHYLRPLTTDTTPRRLLWLDCQPVTAKEGGAMVDRWQVGCLGRTWWTSKRAEQQDRLEVFTDPGRLWSQAAAFCRPGKRVVLFAYDLAYQLRISQGLVHLPAAGWHVDRIVLERTAAWCLLRKGKLSLMCCDLKSWSTASLQRISTECDWTRSQLPAVERVPFTPAARAMANAEAVRLAMLQILDWVQGEQLGPFRPTGSGQSYSAFRRRFLNAKVLVHDQVERLEVERQAMWTGRCEAWRHGTLKDGPYAEYDMTAAYCTIAAECEVPGIAARQLVRPKIGRLIDLLDEYAILAELDVTTDTPAVPTRLGERTVWPVGSFQTVLWDPEWTLAVDRAQRVRCHRAWLYRRTPAVQPFAQWVLDVMAGSMAHYGPLPARVAKHWSRALVGRLGLRYRHWERFGTSPDCRLELVSYLDVDKGEATDVLLAGHDALILTGLAEARDSLPQIPGWVMSECRRRLWTAMSYAGFDQVVYVDTDSLILAPGAQQLGRSPLTNGQRHWWAHRASYDAMVIHGPRNYSTERGRKVSGLPLSARQVAPLEFTGQVMRSIKESMRTGELDHVASIPRRFILDAPDLRRQHLPDGQTTPYALERSVKQ